MIIAVATIENKNISKDVLKNAIKHAKLSGLNLTVQEKDSLVKITQGDKTEISLDYILEFNIDKSFDLIHCTKYKRYSLQSVFCSKIESNVESEINSFIATAIGEYIMEEYRVNKEAC